MREVSPFDYWENHSSVIEGLGGSDRSPDPRYCFHTRYHEVREGRACFMLELGGVSASFGELSMRVHAWKPQTNSNISLVSGARMTFKADDNADLSLSVHFAAQTGVLYALYGYLSEDSDVTAHAIKVIIDEPENKIENRPEPPRSIFAVEQMADEARPANALLHHGPISIENPVSQSCTHEQILALAPNSLSDGDAAIARWGEQICLSALDAYGISYPGLEALVFGPVRANYAEQLAASISLARQQDGPPPSRNDGHFFDILLMPEGCGTAVEARDRWYVAEDWLACLKIGGLAMLVLRYRPGSDLVNSALQTDGRFLSRNEIGQWALRLIGKGYSVAPLAFASAVELVVDSQGLSRFIFIIQRL